jgi:hypothetical protein
MSPLKIVNSHIEQIAAACDVAGVLPERGAKANLVQFRSRKDMQTSSRQSSRRWCLFPFRSLNHLT